MNSLFKNRRIIKLPVTGSTNTYATGLPSSTPEGSIVWALNQTHGKGQNNNIWESESGRNLTFSIIFNPDFLKANQQFYLSKITALAVCDFVKLYTDKVSVKWPNDIFVGDKKIAGVLIETVIEKDFIKRAIVGVGLNINQVNFASDIPNPISLSLITGKEYDIAEMFDLLVELLDYRYSLLMEHEEEIIDENYLDYLYLINKPADFIADGLRFNGTIIDVEPTGELIIKYGDGSIRKFLHKEVEYIL